MGNQTGKYQQHNQGGKPKKAVHWKSAEPPSPPGRPSLIALSDQQPDVINLHWERPKLDGGSQITGYIVEHRRMGSPHWVRATPVPVTTCEVSISGLEPGWRYQFRIIAENVVGRSEPSELSDMLTVTLQRNAISVPRFIDELQDTQAVEDERIEFRVRIQGQPIPEISWFKDGYEIFSSRRTKIVNDNDASVLIIHQVALTDEGEIKCTATNRAGHVVTKCQLMVEAPPKIRLPRTYEDGLIVEADEVLRLKVGIAGQPSPYVAWLHEGEIIKSEGRFEIVNTDKNSMLKIDNIQRDDRGEYSIRATNKLGDDVTSFLVTVTARPDPPGKVRLNMSFGKSATLSWTAPIDDGGCKIGNYIVEYFRVGWNVWLKASTTRSLCTTLNDLIEGSEYKFRVKAENPYGLSDPSEESDVLFIPDPKRGITKPKSDAKLAEVHPSDKPAPPRRKTLSPPRPPQQDASTETSKIVSPNTLRKTTRPQLLDNEELHLEMSYGMPDNVLKSDVRKSPSMSSADSAAQKEKPKLSLKIGKPNASAKSPSRSPVIESPKLGLKIEKPLSPKKSPSRSPTIEISSHVFQKVAEKGASIAQALLYPPLATPERSTTPEINAETQNPPPTLKPSGPIPLRKSPTPPEPIKYTPALQRSTEPVQLGVNQNVRRYSTTLTSAKDAPALVIAIAMGNLGSSNNNNQSDNHNRAGQESRNENKNENKTEFAKENADQKGNSNNRVLYDNGNKRKIEEDIKRKIDNNNADRNRNGNSLGNNNDIGNENGLSSGNGKNNASTISNPTIQISAPPLNAEPPAVNFNPSPPFSPLSASDRHDDVHTSNEFMVVVFDKNSKVKDKSKQDSFELDLEDALQPPPISISSPDLASLEYNNLHSFPLRRSVSSTELLYERAMARFYEAVELEEAEKARKLRVTQDKIATPTNVQPTTTRKRLGSMTEAERLSFEKRSELRRQSADIGYDFKVPTKWSSRENIADAKPLVRSAALFMMQESQESPEDDRESDEMSDIQTRPIPQQMDSYELGSDYTESTASSEEDSMEKFKIDLMARTRSPSPRDLDTYHPRNMAAGVFTPYRAPTPEQSVVVLNRPLPLPSPDFVPKPILKRSSNENILVNEEKISLSPNPVSESKSLDLAKSLKSFFTRDKKTTTEKNTEENEKISNPKEKANAAILAAENEVKRISKLEEERKRQEAERIMQEEAKVAVDHYSDIVRQVGSTHKYHTPLYLDRDELKRAAEKAALEGDEKDDDTDGMAEHLKMRDTQDTDMGSFLAPPQPVRRLSISERGTMIHVRETSSDLAMSVAKDVKAPDTSSEESSNAPHFTPIPPQYTKISHQSSPPSSPVIEHESPLPTTTTTVVSETLVERPDSRGRNRLVKVKRIVKKRVLSSSSRDASMTNRPASSMASTNEISPYVRKTTENVTPVSRRVASRTRSAARGESKSPSALARKPFSVAENRSSESKLYLTLSNGQLLEIKSADQMSEEVHEKVRSALSYCADLVLFVVACYVYLFKDAWLVLPILALMIYRQLGEALDAHIPKWMRRKKEDPS